ncbi:MAG TPA: ABC-2 family transporter protein [Candidatus Eisenbergiella merdipullorum]|uniref:ABC-2 family transporter protein n=1 Tax=Candidatus Eisenbergiella merdipullorum TaxID=2838553 RepID=A0A9D2I8Y0_9FIRM|nr:ABC-2 family transporter protein [Candidatus Eisenbergiella merdipullorum]
MKKYLSFFRLRLNMGMQYRTAAAAGMATQFVWGIMEVLAMRAFYESDPASFPMTLQATCSYIWLQQAFLALFMGWVMEGEIFDSIMDGNIAYELVRPVRIYPMWYARSLANRISKAALRCIPILTVAILIPAPYGLSAPAGPKAFLLFVSTMILGVLVTVAFTMLIYMLSFFTISPDGLRIVFMSVIEFCQGAILPLPFFPDGIRQFLEFLPFASMQNVPLRAYSGDLSGADLQKAILLQLFWLFALVGSGRLLERFALKKVVVQGG